MNRPRGQSMNSPSTKAQSLVKSIDQDKVHDSFNSTSKSINYMEIIIIWIVGGSKPFE